MVSTSGGGTYAGAEACERSHPMHAHDCVCLQDFALGQLEWEWHLEWQ